MFRYLMTLVLAAALCAGPGLVGAGLAETEDGHPVRILEPLVGPSDDVVSLSLGKDGSTSRFSSYFPKVGTTLATNKEFDFNDGLYDQRFRWAFVIESGSAFRITICISKVEELTYLDDWVRMPLQAFGYSPAAETSDFGKADYLVGYGTATNEPNTERLKRAHEASVVVARNGDALVVAIIEYGNDLDRNRDLASRFYSNIAFAVPSTQKFSIDDVLKQPQTETNLSIRASRNWEFEKLEEGKAYYFQNTRITENKINGVVLVSILRKDEADSLTRATNYLKEFVDAQFHRSDFFANGYETSPLQWSGQTKHPLIGRLFKFKAKTGANLDAEIWFMKAKKVDIGFIFFKQEKNFDLDWFHEFRARAAVTALANDAIELADRSVE